MVEINLAPEQQHRVDWRVRHALWFLDKIDEADVEQFVAMFNAALEQAFYEGTIEAEQLLLRIGAEIKRPMDLTKAARYVRMLADKNKASAPT